MTSGGEVRRLVSAIPRRGVGRALIEAATKAVEGVGEFKATTIGGGERGGGEFYEGIGWRETGREVLGGVTLVTYSIGVKIKG